MANEIIEPPLNCPSGRVLKLITKVGNIVTLTPIHRVEDLIGRWVVGTSGHYLNHMVQTVKCIAPLGAYAMAEQSQSRKTFSKVTLVESSDGVETLIPGEAEDHVHTQNGELVENKVVAVVPLDDAMAIQEMKENKDQLPQIVKDHCGFEE